MKCAFCLEEFPENQLDLSHDVPCYIFEGNRKGRKNFADKYGRRYLCKKHHKEYEEALRQQLISVSISFYKKYFGDKNGNS